MQALFVRINILLFGLLVWVSPVGIAQERTTNETKVILAVNKKTDRVDHIVLLSNFQRLDKKELTKEYDRHHFFLGLLKGSYRLHENRIAPGRNTTIIIYTDREFSPPKAIFQGEDFSPGDEFNLGDTKTKVIAHKKGELILRTQKP